MIDFLMASSSILVSALLIAGFLGLAGVIVFEMGAVFYFWVKNAYNDSKKRIASSNTRLAKT